MPPNTFWPSSPKEALRQEYVGKSISQVPVPAAVLNVAALRRNCEGMLRTVRELGLGWRVHVKTHKTVEATRLQVGEDISRPANLVVSTLAEVEFLFPLLEEWVSRGRKVNVLYGLPIVSNAVSRLGEIAKALGHGSVSILLDDPAQVSVAKALARVSGAAVPAYIKVDMGCRRAGVVVSENDARFVELAGAALDAHRDGAVVLSGLYSHAGQSYGGGSRHAAVRMMRDEIEALLIGADKLHQRAARAGVELPTLVLSGGASPTALSVQNLLGGQDVQDENLEAGPELRAEVGGLSALFTTVRDRGHAVEIHAGVYPLLDLQQLAAHSMSASRLSWRDIAFTILAEVHSVYPNRGTTFSNTPEALIGAGGLALGREPCKAYDGMAMVTPWGRKGVEMPTCDVEEYEGWMVGRFSQEHGILTWATGKKNAPSEAECASGPRLQVDMVEVGQKMRLWPNHACIASSHFGWYFVVDEDREGKEDEIVDVWIRARGW